MRRSERILGGLLANKLYYMSPWSITWGQKYCKNTMLSLNLVGYGGIFVFPTLVFFELLSSNLGRWYPCLGRVIWIIDNQLDSPNVVSVIYSDRIYTAGSGCHYWRRRRSGGAVEEVFVQLYPCRCCLGLMMIKSFSVQLTIRFK